MFLDIPPLCKISIYTERGDLIDEIDNPYKYIDPQNIQQYSNLNSKNYVFNPNYYYGYFEDLGKQKTIINELKKGTYGKCYGINQNNSGNYNMIIVFTSQGV